MKILISLFITLSVFAQQPIRREKAAVPLTPDTRPAAWLVADAKKIKEADQAVNDILADLVESLKESYDLVPDYRKPRLMRERQKVSERFGPALEKQVAARAAVTDKVMAGLDNTYGWAEVAPGLEMKLLPGWVMKAVTTNEKLVAYADVNVSMMRLLKPFTENRWMQPILIRADKKKVEAFKCSVSLYDRFGELISEGNLLRCDNTKDEADVWLLDWTMSAANDPSFVNKLEKRLSPLEFAIPFTVTDLVVIAPEKQ